MTGEEAENTISLKVHSKTPRHITSTLSFHAEQNKTMGKKRDQRKEVALTSKYPHAIFQEKRENTSECFHKKIH